MRGSRLCAVFVVLALIAGAVRAEEAPIVDHWFTTSDHVRLNYRQAGHGPHTIVFIPGWLMPAEVFDGQLAHFGHDYRVVSLSPRSQGRSELYHGSHSAALRARDIHEFIRALHTDDFVLVGWSLGVMEGLDYLTRYQPQGLRGLVLIDNSIGEGPAPTRAGNSGPPSTMTEKQRVRYLKGFARAMFKKPPPPTLLSTIEHSALRVPSATARELLAKPYAREYYRSAVYATDVPVLYAITPRLRQQGELLAANRPKATTTVYEDAGHALFVDAEERFDADLGHFLETLY